MLEGTLQLFIEILTILIAVSVCYIFWAFPTALFIYLFAYIAYIFTLFSGQKEHFWTARSDPRRLPKLKEKTNKQPSTDLGASL